MMKEKILVVEDEPALQETLTYNLNRQGYSVETASDGLAALGVARRIRPDLIILDIMLADPSTITGANYLVWVAHNLERLADRVTNICERIVFLVSGEMTELDQTDDELGRSLA